MYPNPNTALFTSVDNDDDKTVIVSNCARRHPNIVNAAANLSTNIPQPIIGHSANAMSINPAHAIADTGATSIFVMKGTKVQNKCRATKLISIAFQMERTPCANQPNFFAANMFDSFLYFGLRISCW